MLVRTKIKIRGFPMWIELETEDLQRNPDLHRRMVEEVMAMLIRERGERSTPKVTISIGE